MQITRPYTLQTKFLLGLTAASLVIGVLIATGFYFQMRQLLNEEVHGRAALILAQADAVKGYVQKTLRPTMYEVVPDTFVIQAMSSSFVTRSVMEKAAKDGGGHVFRRVALSSRNPRFEANEFERGLIQRFRRKPSLTLWQGYEKIGGVMHYVLARPVTYSAGCMRCHGDPKDAPAELAAAYGNRGFGHQLGSIGALDFVSVPVSASVAHLRGATVTFMIMFGMAVLLLFGTANLIFKQVVVNNLRTLVSVFQRNFTDDKGTALLREVERGDELNDMISGMEKLGDHLYDTRLQLQDYAANLENKVRERTEELSVEAGERRADVRLFVDLLGGFSHSHSRPELWRQSLPFVGLRFDLAYVTFICGQGMHRHYSWPREEQTPDLPENWLELLAEAKPLYEDHRAIVPVESPHGTAEGLLCMYQKPGRSFRPQDRAVLRAIGRQLGIASENLAALDSILRHSANLQSIFEGITDPLLLVDDTGDPVMVNSAARRLSADLSGGATEGGQVIPFLCESLGDNSDCDISEAIRRDSFVFREVTLAGGRSFALSIYPVRDDGGERGQVVVSVRETTGEKRMLAQVTQSEKMATVGKLAAGLAHEINNPLGVILCYAELLKNGITGDQQRDDVDVIVRHTRQAQNVLRDLLNFARPKLSTSVAVDMPTAVEAVADVFRIQAEKKGAVIHFHAEAGMPPVLMEPQVVEHVTANLLINALDAVPESGGEVRVELSYDASDGMVLFTVADNGPGIPEDVMPFIFDPFFTTKEVNKGSGLGLAVIYGFVTDLGGRIRAVNREGGGAEFRIRLPVADGAKEDKA
ncbi:c-type heme family protein [Desulfocurvus sp. DL9XJH121]